MGGFVCLFVFSFHLRAKGVQSDYLYRKVHFVLKINIIVLWQNASAAIPKLRQSLCKKECGQEKAPERENSANDQNFSKLWRNIEEAER